jgi:hypothetical protein
MPSGYLPGSEAWTQQRRRDELTLEAPTFEALMERFPDFARAALVRAQVRGQAIASDAKALRCTEIAQRVFPHTPEHIIETIAVDLMSLTDNGISNILQHLRAQNPSSMKSEKPVPGTGVIKKENRYTLLRKNDET